MSFRMLEFAILLRKALNKNFPLIMISLNAVRRSSLHYMISVIVGVNEKMLNLMH